MKRLRLIKIVAANTMLGIVILVTMSTIALFAAEETPLGEYKGPTTLAIMNFTNRSPTGEWQWLSKGLADMLITDLSQAGELQVVERERMQKLFEEMALSTTGLIDEATAVRFGKVAKVDKALFGSFLKEGDNLSIEAHIIDVATGELIRVEWVRGKAEDVFKLEKELAFKIIKNLHVKLTKAERDSIRYVPTDNIDAATHFYAGIGCLDSSQYRQAFVEFRGALRNDENYAVARFWLANSYFKMKEFEHAVIEYEKVMKRALPSNLFDKLVIWSGDAYKEVGRYQEAINSYFKYVEKHINDMRQWGRVEALQKKIHLIIGREYYRTYRLLKPPGGIITFDPRGPVYFEDYTTEKRLLDAMGVNHNER